MVVHLHRLLMTAVQVCTLYLYTICLWVKATGVCQNYTLLIVVIILLSWL